MKKKLIFTSLALAAMALGVGTSVFTMAKDGADLVKAEATVQIGDLATFKSVFDGSASYYNRNIELTADIDYGGGSAVGLRMAGSYSGTFNGNGHTISNITLSQAFFNLVSGTIENLTFNCTSTGSGFGGLAYAIEGAGKVTNVNFNATVGAAINSWGPVAFWSKGTISNCKAYITIPTVASSSNTLFHIARDDGGTFTNNLYKVTGTASFGADPTGVAELVAVTAVTVADVSVAATATTIATATLTGNDYNHIKWAVANSSTATVASATTTTNTVTINGLVTGSTTLTATVYGDAAEGTILAQTTAKITVTSGTAVTGVTLSKTSTTLKAGLTEAITATLTGDLYDHISWASDATSYATVSGSGLSATIAAVAIGSANITVTVYNASNVALAAATCAVTVQAPSGFTIYIFDQQADNTTHNSASVFVYNTGDIDNAAATRVTNNGVNVGFRMTDPADSAVKSWIVWSYFVNTTAHPSVSTGSYLQLSFNGIGRWGAGMNLATITEDIFCVAPAVGSSAPTKLGSDWTTANYSAAMTYAASTIYGGTWRVSDSICYKKTDSAGIKTLCDNYDALATGVKTIAGALDDSTTAYTATYADTITMLRAYYPSGSGSAAISTSKENDATMIALVVGFGVLALAGGAFIYLRKKQH